VKEFLRNNPEVADEIEAQIRAALTGGTIQPLVVGAGVAVAAGKNGASDEEEGEF
jgi:hypothetical protein